MRREELKISQESVARMVGVSLSGYQKIEKVKAYPSVIVAKRICTYLGLDLWDVAEWDESLDKDIFNNPLLDMVLKNESEKRIEKLKKRLK